MSNPVKPILGLLASVALFCSAIVVSAPVRAESPFSSLAGTWSGHGTANFDDGKKESLRCKGYYRNENQATELGLSIRCANASAKLELRANLNYKDGKISGQWEERTYNQTGTVSGHASGDKLQLAIGGGIEGSMAITVAGRRHSVVVSTAGPALKGFNLSMAR